MQPSLCPFINTPTHFTKIKNYTEYVLSATGQCCCYSDVRVVMGRVIATHSISSQEGWTLWTDNIPLSICVCVCHGILGINALILSRARRTHIHA